MTQRKRPSRKQAEALFWKALDPEVLDAENLERALASGHVDPNVTFDHLGDGRAPCAPLERLVMYPGEKSRRCMEVLLRHGADIHRGEYDSLLRDALLFGDQETISLLFDHGAKIEEPGNIFRGYTELDNLLFGGAPLDLFRLVMARGEIILPPPDSQEMFALFSRILGAHHMAEEYLDYFLEEVKVPIDLSDRKSGQTLLIMAAEQEDQFLCDLLVARGADRQIRDAWGHDAEFYLTIDERFRQMLAAARMAPLSPDLTRKVNLRITRFAEDMIFAYATGANFPEAIEAALDVAGHPPARAIIAVCDGTSILQGCAREALSRKFKQGKKLPQMLVIAREKDWECDHASVFLVIDPRIS